ncbi:hypothetical protein EDC01DRAFT_788899 [Geopyxis carbonaria]|nr:hypothetical protein EDC01DRAFT_788899 [Geopyxis carbonaria]
MQHPHHPQMPYPPPHPQQHLQHPQQAHPHTPQRAQMAPPPPSPYRPTATPGNKRFKPPPQLDDRMTVEDEEDTSRGDAMDHYTQRDIASARYVQHHEWMEEIVGSAYPIGRISAAEVNHIAAVRALLGPPPAPAPAPADPPAATDEAAKLQAWIAKAEVDIERAQTEHRVRLAAFARGSVFRELEAALRGGLASDLGLDPPAAVEDEEPTSPMSGADGDEKEAKPVVAPAPVLPDRPVDEVWREAEQRTEKRIVPATPVTERELPVEMLVEWGLTVAPPPVVGGGIEDEIMADFVLEAGKGEDGVEGLGASLTEEMLDIPEV